MAKFSVKKPLTVFVVVLAIVVLGVVAYLRMTPDLLPNMDFPYVVIVTTDPGASPESVEETITRPMEQSMATLDRIKTVTSTTQNSVSMVMLEFEDGVNMDTISVDIQQKISILQGQWSDSVGAPYVLKINPSMIPVMVAAVSQEGKDVYALSDFVTDELTGKLEGVSGVASVTVSGALTREAHVILDQEKMDALSATLEDAVKDQLKKAEGKLRDAEKKVTDGQQALADAKRAAADGVAESVGDAVDKVYDKLKDIYGVLEDTDIDDIVGGFITDPDGTLKKLNDDLKTLQGSMEKLMKALKSGHLRAQVEGDVSDLLVELMDGMTQMTGAELQLSEAKAQIESGLKQIQAAYDKVAEQTDLGGLLSISTVSGLLTAQNFSMPAGYVKDESGESWLLKVGEEYDSVDDIRGALLLHVEGYGDVRLSDVADVEIIDNAADSYTRLNGEQASVLKIYKDDSSSAGDVSANCLDAFKELEAQYEGLHVVVLSNQGNYISILIKSILTSMLVGAALAIVVLAIFLKDVKPTLVVGVSIPLSVLFAVVLMYFTGLDLNVMTLAGLSLGIGMLVDNSVVVIENIYRLRGRGVPAARAAVQGARQVGMSVVASTLTSVCVFLPAVFSASLIRSLMGPMSLCIGYCLMASLIVALTVVPAASATVLKNAQPKKLAWFDKIQNAYGRSLEKALKNRFVPLAAAVLLLVFCCWRVVSMGIVLLPTSTSNEAMITLSTTDTLSKDESYDVAGKVVQAVMAVDGVEEVGITPDNTVAGMDVSNLGLPSTITDLLNAANGYGKYKINVKLNEELSSSKIDAACKAMEEAVAGVADCTATVQQYGMTDDLTSQLSTGLTIKIYGTDAETLTALSEKVVDIVNNTEGFQNATNGLGAGDSTIILQVDRDKVRANGLTVAQVYQQIAAKLTTTTTAQTPVTVDGTTMDVQISNNLDPLTKENMMDMTFETTVMSADGTTATGTCKLSDIASWTTGTAPDSITSENQTRYITVTADTLDGYNTTVQSRVLQKKLDEYAASGEMPEGCSTTLGGETEGTDYMVNEMVQWMALALPFVYLVMVAQFQSLLSPFIVLFTVPLAFTGGLLGLLLTGQQLTMISMMGFIVLMGTVVNNGIVFVDYANQLRMGGMERRAALVATGKTRMRPILMTTLTTVLAMLQMVFSNDMASQLMSGMAIVIICGLSYATLMTLYIVPILYDILFKKPPLNVDIGSDEDLDDIPDDAAEFIAAQSSAAQPQPEA